MKAKIIPILGTFILLVSLFYSCEDSTYKEYKGNEPVYISFEELRGAVTAEQNVALENPGKIYFKDNYIFIVEELKGIHVFDNSNPASPVNKTFLKVPGVVDISISGTILYADSFVDLVVLDIQNIDNIIEVGRLKDILPYTVPATGNEFPMAYVDQKKGVVVSWKLKTIREKVITSQETYPVYYDQARLFTSNISPSGASSGVSGSGVGIGGSMARFGIKDKVLYVLEKNTLKIFDITNKTDPFKSNEIYPGSNVETMFLTGKNMFLGTTTGMVIYDVSVPLSPARITFFNHARSCDPVIVDDTLAYVTLRTGTSCGGNLNSLDIVNIKNLSKPIQVISYGMNNPHGLGKDGDLLFICDGDAGLKVFDASNPRMITSHLIYSYPHINAYDVIPIGKTLVLIGNDGLYQYNYSNVANITLLSKIPVVVVN
jgi:hypothetical protein